MNALTVRGLCKKYPGFALEQVSFPLEEGSIMGLIGRNGAGKTTTLSSLLGLVHPDSGDARFFGLDFRENEWEIKQRVGFISGGAEWYPRKRLKAITNVTKRFYRDWDDSAYRRYLTMFQLSEDETPSQLSAGMKVKYALALAMSHKARLLILDEPTSGLDPLSREELLDVFLELSRQEGTTILFSTHITADLEKCADSITYLQGGRVPYSGSLRSFLESYRLVRFREEPRLTEGLIGLKREKEGWSALQSANAPAPPGGQTGPAGLDDIMVHLERSPLLEGGELT